MTRVSPTATVGYGCYGQVWMRPAREKLATHIDAGFVAALMGEHLGRQLKELATRHKCVADVSGRGTMWFVHLAKNRQTGELFVPQDRYAIRAGRLSDWPAQIVIRECFARGVSVSAFCAEHLAHYSAADVGAGGV
jgi:4-aminobutyrate aminotransferase-like enzyme